MVSLSNHAEAALGGAGSPFDGLRVSGGRAGRSEWGGAGRAGRQGARYTGPAMPIYQYDCAGCDRRVDVFFRSVSSAGDPACPQCGSAELSRVMSAFARTRSSSDRVASIDFSQEMGRLGTGSERDFAKWAKRMGREYDGELGSNFSELAEKAESGEDPIERVDPGFKLQHEINKSKKKSGGGSHDGGAS